MQCPRCQHDNSTTHAYCSACGTPLKRLDERRSYLELERDLTEALDQQTATAEILRVISSSPTDVQPVFDVIVERAVRLCGARFGRVYRYDGAAIYLVASHGLSARGLAEVQQIFPRPAANDTIAGRAIVARQPVYVRDIERDQDVPPLSRRMIEALGTRSQVTIPMLRVGEPIGALTVGWADQDAFDEQQVALLKTFAHQAVIAIENVRLFKELEGRNRDLTEALEQQTATAEVLKVMSRSTFDLQPVLETLIENAVRLCGASRGSVYRFNGNVLRHATSYNVSQDAADFFDRNPIAPGRYSMAARVALERRTQHIPDILADSEYTFGVHQVEPIRTALGVPMMKGDDLLGAFTIWKLEVQPFTDRQIELVTTFADQAVIAIENVRLFTELQEKNQSLMEAHAQVTETLEQQTATSEILSVMSASPTDVQPVFDSIAESAARLCEAPDVSIFVREADHLRVAARHGRIPSDTALPLSRESGVGWAVLTGRTIHIADMQTELERFPVSVQNAKRLGFRTALNVPLMREGSAIGAISLRRTEAHLFAERQVALLETFADQAVIAIENVRLFTELEARNRDLTESLDQQTATSEILRTIAQAPTDARPVFDTIVRSAARLCKASNGGLFLVAGGMLYEPANYGSSPEALAAARARYPRPAGMDTPPGMAVLTRSVIHVPDTEEPSTLEHARQAGRLLGIRSIVAVPMLREGEAIGAIIVGRREPGIFSDAEVELLKTFADQAVIAVENVRLFKELEARTAELTRSVGELTALGEISQVLSSTLDLETVLTTIVSRAVQLSGVDGGVVFEYDEGVEEFVHRAATETGGALTEARPATRVRKGEGVVGRTAVALEPVQVPDITGPGAYVGQNRENLIESGIRAILAVPMVREGHLIGCLVVSRNQPGDFPAETIELLRTFATQSALAIQNARLFHEIADKSRQLEVASQHKSEFLANMSHELRTPLNAILGFSEVLAQGMFGEVNEKQSEYLRDILDSGRHLLSLINDILDLSKIEAGRMELEVSEFDLPQAIQNALTLIRERALRRGIALHQVIDDRVAEIRADERKVKQVLLNLLSNAIKFTPEGGRIDVRAAPADGLVEVSVTDSGVGIAPEDQDAVFEEFRQVGTADKKAEGTGLGLALSRKFIELHGRRIAVHSQVGAGSTFTFTLPVHGRVSPLPAG
jgi:GAF domain-containing protein